MNIESADVQRSPGEKMHDAPLEYDGVVASLRARELHDVQPLIAGLHGNLVFRAHHPDHGAVVAKVTRPSRATWLTASQHWSRRLRVHGLQCPQIYEVDPAVALPSGQHAALLIEEFVPGCPPITTAHYYEIGAFLARLHQLPTTNAPHHIAGGLAEVIDTWNATNDVPAARALAPVIEAHLDSLARQPNVVAHCDLHVANVATGPNGIYALDLEMMQLAPAEFDIGRVLSNRSNLLFPAIARPVLAGYVEHGGRTDLDIPASITATLLRKMWLHSTHRNADGTTVTIPGLYERLGRELTQVESLTAETHVVIGSTRTRLLNRAQR